MTDRIICSDGSNHSGFVAIDKWLNDIVKECHEVVIVRVARRSKLRFVAYVEVDESRLHPENALDLFEPWMLRYAPDCLDLAFIRPGGRLIEWGIEPTTDDGQFGVWTARRARRVIASGYPGSFLVFARRRPAKMPVSLIEDLDEFARPERIDADERSLPRQKGAENEES